MGLIMKYAVYLPVLGKNGENWIYLFDKKGAPILFATKEAAEMIASEYKYARVVEYE